MSEATTRAESSQEIRSMTASAAGSVSVAVRSPHGGEGAALAEIEDRTDLNVAGWRPRDVGRKVNGVIEIGTL